MVTDRKGHSMIVFTFTTVTLLSCFSSVSSFFLPRVSRTNDAIIIDFTGVGYAPLHLGKNYREIIYPAGFLPTSSFNHFAAVQQQQQSTFYKGWSYSNGHPSLMTPVAVLSGRQFAKQQSVKQGTNTSAIQCGRGPASFPSSRSLISERISGGTDANRNSWPFIVYISAYWAAMSGVPCVGSLISDTKVLLAAQCFEKMPLVYASMLTVSIGVQGMIVNTDQTANIKAKMTRRITNVVLHSQFNALNFANDIAIITLDAPVPFSRTVAPVCLPAASTDPDQYADQDALLLGWHDKSPPFLKEGVVSILSNDECKTSIGGLESYVSDTTFCVDSIKVFTCSEDIGGPVVVMSSPGTWTQIGINSYASPGCDPRSIKTRVSAFRNWIDRYLSS